MNAIDKELEATIQALEAVRLFVSTYATSEKSFDGIRAVADALYPIDAIDNHSIRKGVADAIRASFGPIT